MKDGLLLCSLCVLSVKDERLAVAAKLHDVEGLEGGLGGEQDPPNPVQVPLLRAQGFNEPAKVLDRHRQASPWTY